MPNDGRVIPSPATVRPAELTLRFLAAPTDVAFLGGTAVGGGRVLEWIDKAGYACAVGWSGRYCVTAYVGNVNFGAPIRSGELVEVHARLVHTGTSSMHIEVDVRSADPRTGRYAAATSCLMIFVAMGENARPVPVPSFVPITESDQERQRLAVARIGLRADIEAELAGQQYTDDHTAPEVVLRFLAAPTDVNWGGKTHGGTVMRWIDEAAYACACRWSGGERSIAVYSGGIRFYRPVLIGSLVQVRARLLYTGRSSMHIAVHVSSSDPRGGDFQLTTHCSTVFVGLDLSGRSVRVPTFTPQTQEDVRLQHHARQLIAIRARMNKDTPD